MTEAEKNEIVGLVMTEISSQAVDFDITTEQPQANDLLTAVRQTSSGEYKGVTIKWDDVARIATELANQAATRAEQALSDTTATKTEVGNMKASVEQTVTDFNALAEEKKQEVQGVYQNDLDELKGDLTNSKKAIAELDDKKITKFYASNNGNTNLPDSDSGKPTDMKIFGKSVQDGIPSPSNPIEIRSVVNPIVRMEGKNLLNPTLQTTTVNGITCTNNGDGTYTLNGTAIKQIVFNIIGPIVNNLTGNKLLGCPSGGSISTYCMLISYYNKDNIWLSEIYERGDGYIIEENPKLSL